MKNSRNYLRVITLIYCIYMWLFATHFHFMALNVLLAYIPIELSYLLNAENVKGLVDRFCLVNFILMRRTYLRIFSFGNAIYLSRL